MLIAGAKERAALQKAETIARSAGWRSPAESAAAGAAAATSSSSSSSSSSSLSSSSSSSASAGEKKEESLRARFHREIVNSSGLFPQLADITLDYLGSLPVRLAVMLSAALCRACHVFSTCFDFLFSDVMLLILSVCVLIIYCCLCMHSIRQRRRASAC